MPTKPNLKPPHIANKLYKCTITFKSVYLLILHSLQTEPETIRFASILHSSFTIRYKDARVCQQIKFMMLDRNQDSNNSPLAIVYNHVHIHQFNMLHRIGALRAEANNQYNVIWWYACCTKTKTPTRTRMFLQCLHSKKPENKNNKGQAKEIEKTKQIDKF